MGIWNIGFCLKPKVWGVLHSLVGVEINHGSGMPLCAPSQDEEAGFIKNKVIVWLVMANVEKTSRNPHTDVFPPTFEGDDGDDLWWLQSRASYCYPQDLCTFHQVHKLHLQMGIVRQLLQPSGYCFTNLY